MKKSLFIFGSIILLGSVCFSQEKTDIWEPVRFLEGVWEGRGEGLSGVSEARQEYRFIMKQTFMHMQTRSVFAPQEKNPKGETHEDWGFFSFDKTRKKIILRSFHIEGFVNKYVLEDVPQDGSTLVFSTEEIENAPPGTKAKLIFKQLDASTLEQKFEVAFPGRDYTCFTTNILKKSEKGKKKSH